MDEIHHEIEAISCEENPILEKHICQQFLLLYAHSIGVLLFVFCSW